jgi:phage terminase large subunit GpA-like protein
MNALEKIQAKVLGAVAPPEKLSISDWAARNMWLPRAIAAEPGRYNPTRFPWSKEPLDAILDPTVAENVWLWGAQLGKTTCLLATLGYFSHWIPSPILVKYPTQDSAESFSKEKLQLIIEESPALRKVYAEGKSRFSDCTISFKRFAGGHIAMIGANSPTELRQRSCRVILQDEIDSDPLSVGIEGDPVALADARASTFSDAIFIKSSTPTLKGRSKIESAFLATDQRRFYVPCPHCGFYQVLVFEQIKFESERLHLAAYECKSCLKLFQDVDRLRGIQRGEWRPTAPFNGKRGYHLSGLYRMIGLKRNFQTYLHAFVCEALDAKVSEERLVVWINTFKAETFEVSCEKVEHSALFNRREDYEGIPNEVCCLVAGVDVQGNRLEAEIVGYGDGEESWGIEYKVCYGDPSQEAVWDELDAWLTKPKKRNDGTPMTVFAVGIDTGHATDQAYNFVKNHPGRRYYALKGKGGPGNAPVSLPRKSGVKRVRLYQVGTDALKLKLYSRFNRKEAGKGYCHWNKQNCYDEEYFRQLTSEVIVEKHGGGQTYIVFEQRGRNEPLDIRVYVQAAIMISRVNLTTLSKSMPVNVVKGDEDAETTKDGKKEPTKKEEEPKSNPRIRPKSGWMGRF